MQSWVEPYPKPIILNHDLNSEPMGRVMAARMDKEEDGSSFVRLQVAITDPVAIEKIRDKRYLTGSVGGRAGKAICSISGDDLAREDENGRPKMSKFRRGQVYKGKLAFIDMQDISFKEYSFVNQPADGKSSIRSINSGDKQALENTSDGWVAKSAAFVLHMDKEEIVSVEENESVLSKLKKKESKPLYLHVKGAFLTALSIQESENYNNTNDSLLSNGDKKISTDSQENETMNISTHEEDILAVAEELSNDLSSIASDAKQEEANEAAEETVDAAEEAAQEEAVEENSSEEVEESKEEVEEASSEEVSDDNSEKADEQAKEAVDSEEAEKPEEKSDDVQAQSEESTQEDAPLNDEKDGVAENEHAELLAKNKALQEENQKLRSALHRTLVERVVDAKIAAGVESAEAREELIEEHAQRTASSLADSLRDLAKMPQVREAKVSMPEISLETEIVEGENNAITIDSEENKVRETKVSTPEQLFVDALMGRRKL